MNRKNDMYDHSREIKDAIDAGQRALISLYTARDELDKASNWGLMDVFGGGLLSGLFKHSGVEKAYHLLEAAQADLVSFQKEIDDVRNIPDLTIDISSFDRFADFFFDGIIADLLVQSKIEDAGRKVERTIGQVENAMRSLEDELHR